MESRKDDGNWSFASFLFYFFLQHSLLFVRLCFIFIIGGTEEGRVEEVGKQMVMLLEVMLFVPCNGLRALWIPSRIQGSFFHVNFVLLFLQFMYHVYLQ